MTSEDDEVGENIELTERLVEMANASQARDTDDLRRVFETHDVVFGVWQDAEAEHGVGVMLIQGVGQLEQIRFSGISEDASLTAVPCRSPEEAEAMRKVFGDVAKAH